MYSAASFSFMTRFPLSSLGFSGLPMRSCCEYPSLMRKGGKEIARVEVHDVEIDVDRRGSGGTVRTREAGDWAPPAWVALQRARRLHRTRFLRVEHCGADPAWLDVIGLAADGWIVRVRLLKPADDHGTDVEAIELRRMAGDKGVGSRMIRKMGLGGFLELVDDALEVDYRLGTLSDGGWRRKVRRPGRSGRPEVFYAEWAQRYVDALSQAPRTPIQWLIDAEEVAGRERATAAQLRAYVNRARERGLLTASPPGKAGGELTSKARRLLREGK